jgi:hypothetical protein
MASRDDDFLGRWSRRKVESRRGLKKKEERAGEAAPVSSEQPARPSSNEPRSGKAVDERAAAEPTRVPDQIRTEESAPAVAVNDTPAAKDDEEALSEEELGEFADVDFDKLNYGSDYSRFMKAGVPEAIRRRALRKLWASNPLLANIDGLNDYDEDFSDAALATKIIGSNYKPGSGYLSEEERLASYGDEARSAGEASEEDAVALAADEDAGETDGLDDEEDFGTETAAAGAGEDDETADGVAPDSHDKA